ncbi:hypothetical protein WME91_39570 [Sorangium sp. So ce269]
MTKPEDTNSPYTDRMVAAWERAKQETVFRERLIRTPEATLKALGWNESDEDYKAFVSRLKSADVQALLTAFESGEKNATC